MDDSVKDVATILKIPSVATILNVVCRTTGMGFAAVSRVTEEKWIACSVLDHIEFGLEVGGELHVESTICDEIRNHRQPVAIDEVSEDPLYRQHPTPQKYGFQSYISVPIVLPGDQFFGTLCAIHLKPARLNNPAIIGMFTMFAELIALHIGTVNKLETSEENLQKEREHSKLREEFIAVLGHDLRSPLGAITMGAALLKESDLEERVVSLVAMIENGAGRMAGMIDDVMDFARGRLGGGISLENRRMEAVGPLLEQAAAEARANWPGRTVTLQLELDEPADHDPKRLSQLISNLVSNAMQHGKPDGDVRIQSTSWGGHLKISVSNAADLIPPEVMRRIFEPFQRGETGSGKEGLGLGLYIASQIAKSHGGRLEVCSTGDETRFTFVRE